MGALNTESIINVFKNPTIIIDENLKIFDINSEALLFFNISYEEIVSSTISCVMLEGPIRAAIEKIESVKSTITFSLSNSANVISEWVVFQVNIQEIKCYVLSLKHIIDDNYLSNQNTWHIIESIADIMPGNFYWKDTQGVYLGCNNSLLETLGFASKAGFIGKTDYDLWPEQAEELRKNDLFVMESGKPLEREEVALLADGSKAYFSANKTAMRDRENRIIGIIGNSLDITAQKRIKQLEIENVVNKTQLDEQKKFTKIALQLAHDIRSPLSSLLMIVKSCAQIPELERIALREAAISIGDIANSLLSRFNVTKHNHKSNVPAVEERQSILVSAILLQLLADKRNEYNSSLIRLTSDINTEGHFAFIKIDPSAFKRTISNIINNAVDAFDNQTGEIQVKLLADNLRVKIQIIDNGKGMPPDLVKKIMQKIPISVGKKSGYGIGLTQVHEALSQNEGQLNINSLNGKGTTITLTFPRVKAMPWLAEEIKLDSDNIVVILDDDHSIHKAWTARFDVYLKSYPSIKLIHFTQGNETINFINTLAPAEKQKIFLLTDYELLNQLLNGLDIIEECHVNHAILVTSHYANTDLQEKAVKNRTKILPKQLASEVHIVVNEKSSKRQNSVDLIVVDDDKVFSQNLKDFVLMDYIVDIYHDPNKLLEVINKYQQNTKIILDNQFGGKNITGLELAQKLYALGFSQLYLLSGDDFGDKQIPSYLKAMRKDDIDSIHSQLRDR